jgi:hypothetical protein
VGAISPCHVVRVLAVVAVGSAVALAATVPAVAKPFVHTGPPAIHPAAGTPQLIATKVPEQVRQLARCGKRMYAVGSFTRIGRGHGVIKRQNVFSFSASAPYRVSHWHPRVNGTVNSIAFDGKHCRHAYLGGDFTRVNKRTVSNLVEVTTRKGSVTRRFKANANREVETLLMWHKRLLTGGTFTTINGKTHHRYFASLKPKTGAVTRYLSLKISGHYQYRNSMGQPSVVNPSRVFNLQLSHRGNRLLVEGDFKRIGGKPRQQIAMLNLRRRHATTNLWYPKEFNRPCQIDQPFYAKAAAWSFTDSQVFVATDGGLPASGLGSERVGPRSGLCDAASAFPSARHRVRHQWINYTGCDSLSAVVADPSTVYIGGHERWANNSNQCDNNDLGTATPAQGMAGLSPATGHVTYNPSRARGFGADDMIITNAGLWIASDNFAGADQCGHVHGHAGICLLPY